VTEAEYLWALALVRELQRACFAAIFGMPGEESVRLRGELEKLYRLIESKGLIAAGEGEDAD
jgi:hypothetical protein